KTMIQRVVERVRSCNAIGDVLVATDDERIYSHVVSLGAPCVMTSPNHPSGTDRCLEAYQRLGIAADAIINVQGDEPFVDASQLETLASLISKPAVTIATLAKKISDTATLLDSSKVKVVLNARMQALYFSRQAIPFVRNAERSSWVTQHTYHKHLGLYAYKPKTLEDICALAPSSLEIAESLEQLRWLENGFSIDVALTEIETPAIDTPEDLKGIEMFL
ncbi:MAG: 3-deoxy-manno-octulosonate cytidylyltransferase, partial [Flavobacteriales bacterium]